MHFVGLVLTHLSDRFFLRHESSYGNDTWLYALSISYPWQSARLIQAGTFSICGAQLRLSSLYNLLMSVTFRSLCTELRNNSEAERIPQKGIWKECLQTKKLNIHYHEPSHLRRFCPFKRSEAPQKRVGALASSLGMDGLVKMT